MKSQNKVYYYIMSKSKDIIDLILIENDIAKAIKDDDEGYLIMIKSEKNSMLLDSETEIIFSNLKDKFFDKVIALYKNKCRQYIK